MIRPAALAFALLTLAGTAIAGERLVVEGLATQMAGPPPAVIKRELEAMRLPVVRATKPIAEPLPPVVRITRDAIYVQGALAGKTELLAKAGEWDAPWLEGKLRATRAQSDGERIVLAIEPEVPFRTVKKAMSHASKAGYHRVLFAVRAADSPAVVAFELPPLPAGQTPPSDPLHPIMGSLDPKLIDGVIKSHLEEIKYCYDRELPRKPRLAGKIVVSFTIEADGLVSLAKIKSTTMNDDAVEGCITSRFLDFVFPRPNGGGIVKVNYPLLFSSSRN